MPTDARGNYLPEPPYLGPYASHSSRYDMLAIISSHYQYGPFLFFCCRSYVKLLDYWQAENFFSTSGGPPEARGICHIRHWLDVCKKPEHRRLIRCKTNLCWASFARGLATRRSPNLLLSTGTHRHGSKFAGTMMQALALRNKPTGHCCCCQLMGQTDGHMTVTLTHYVGITSKRNISATFVQ